MCVSLVGYAVDAAEKGNRKLVPLFPRKPIKGVMSSLSIIDRIYASIASCIFIEVLGIKHYSPQNHLI
jgi:hypothetical protein